MTWGLYTSNLEHFGYTRLEKIALFCFQGKGLFPGRTPKFLLNQGCFPLGWA